MIFGLLKWIATTCTTWNTFFDSKGSLTSLFFSVDVIVDGDPGNMGRQLLAGGESQGVRVSAESWHDISGGRGLFVQHSFGEDIFIATGYIGYGSGDYRQGKSHRLLLSE